MRNVRINVLKSVEEIKNISEDTRMYKNTFLFTSLEQKQKFNFDLLA